MFGDGWHLFSVGSGQYEEVSEEFASASQVVNGFIESATENGVNTEAVTAALDTESETFSEAEAKTELEKFAAQFDDSDKATYTVVDEETMADEQVVSTGKELKDAVAVYESYDFVEPDPADYGIWVPGIPVLIGDGLAAINCAPWLEGLILDGVVAGVGAVLGFVPQMFVLFILH